MRIFIDTSSLFKKYVREKGSDVLEAELNRASEIVVAPTYWIEANSIIQRRVREKLTSRADADQVRVEIEKDLNFFHKVTWSEALEQVTVQILQTHSLRPLDGLQLASALQSEVSVFLTSDQKLYKAAAKELKGVKLI